MDFSFLDVLLDSVFVVDANKSCIYCNDAAAKLCQSSIKRLTRGRPIFEYIQFLDADLFIMPNGNKGQQEVFPLTELEFYVPNNLEQKGKVQITISPITDKSKKYWIVLIRDVTVEEVLHEKYKLQLEQLEQYSKNLEKMVEERTLELKSANNLLKAIMNSLGQGFLVFDEKGTCLSVYTKACEEVLESKPSGKNIVTVLNCTGNEKEQFEMWIKAVFSEALPFESLKELGPQQFFHSKGKYITLDFFAIYSENNKVENLVLVATDRSAERDAQVALENEKSYANMIVKFVTHRKLFTNFISSFPQNLGYLSQQITNAHLDLNEIFRRIHTLEGEAATLSVSSILEKTKNLQEVISLARNKQLKELSDVKDDYVFALQELSEAYKIFIDKNKDLINLLDLSDNHEKIEIQKDQIFHYYKLFEKYGLDKNINDQFLSEFTQVSIFAELEIGNSILSQVAVKQNKKIRPIIFLGEDLRVDANEYTDLFSSFVHVFRNIVDHGLEEPQVRLDCGKPEFGSVTISVKKKIVAIDDFIQIRIVDDGRGIDPQIIRKKLNEKNPEIKWSNIDDHSILQEIFKPGLSSRDQAGEFSGRGVGMDAVKTEVLKMEGKIEVFSVLQKGTTIEILLPASRNKDLLKSA
ncbi:MAG: Hpt domain-containing protein [Bdellovibrionaceae bacterium]|nr:Hpt domain-containing protein [Pseudobdellovibrionaceae bacterium]